MVFNGVFGMWRGRCCIPETVLPESEGLHHQVAAAAVIDAEVQYELSHPDALEVATRVETM
jgi:hypothetical protein